MTDRARALEAAISAARAAASCIREGAHEVRHKGPIDLVTEVDLAAERAIRLVLGRFDPAIPVLGEEEGGAHDARTRWVVDPLDGTTNFVHGFPAYGVSIALEVDGVLEVGCVLDPIRDSVATAIRGQGAFQDGVRLLVSEAATLADALLLTGFPYDRRERAAYYLRFVEAALERTQGIRRAGAAALDLVHVAAGRAEGFWEFGLSPWDIAAGSLLVVEAGGRVTNMDGTPLQLGGRRLLATNGRIHEELGAMLLEVDPQL